MNSEPRVAAIWNHPRAVIFCAALFAMAFSVACVIILHSAENRLREEHDIRVGLEEQNEQARKLLGEAKDALEADNAQLDACRKSSSQNLTDSIAHLQTKTILLTSLPEQPQGADAALLPMMQRAGLFGLLMEVVQASQKQTSRAPQPAQVWIVPTTVEPMFAGDASRAWVIHADVATGRSVDTPHHPVPVTAVK